jgi:ribosome-binding protein aMBF1 (putative translation factor)
MLSKNQELDLANTNNEESSWKEIETVMGVSLSKDFSALNWIGCAKRAAPALEIPRIDYSVKKPYGRAEPVIGRAPPSRKERINAVGQTDVEAHDLKAAMREDFARRLTAARMRKGWNQSELARNAAKHVDDGVFGRALVSSYERARMFPNPFHLKALSATLGVQPDDSRRRPCQRSRSRRLK